MIQISNDVQQVIDRIFLDCATSKVKKLDICGEIDTAISKLDKITFHKKAKDVDEAPFAWKREDLFLLKVRYYMFSYKILNLPQGILVTVEEVAKNGQIITEKEIISYSEKKEIYESVMTVFAKALKCSLNKKDIINESKNCSYDEKKEMCESVIIDVAKILKHSLTEADAYKGMDDTDIMIVELGDFIKSMQRKYKKRNKIYGQNEIAKLIKDCLILMFDEE